MRNWPDPDPAVTQVSASNDAVTFRVEGLSDGVEIRKFSGEWQLNTICPGLYAGRRARHPFVIPFPTTPRSLTPQILLDYLLIVR